LEISKESSPPTINPKPQLIQVQIPATKTTIIPALMAVFPAPAVQVKGLLIGGVSARAWPVMKIKIICMAKAMIPLDSIPPSLAEFYKPGVGKDQGLNS
jgi:hypothetical protein